MQVRPGRAGTPPPPGALSCCFAVAHLLDLLAGAALQQAQQALLCKLVQAQAQFCEHEDVRQAVAPQLRPAEERRSLALALQRQRSQGAVVAEEAQEGLAVVPVVAPFKQGERGVGLVMREEAQHDAADAAELVQHAQQAAAAAAGARRRISGGVYG